MSTQRRVQQSPHTASLDIGDVRHPDGIPLLRQREFTEPVGCHGQIMITIGQAHRLEPATQPTAQTCCAHQPGDARPAAALPPRLRHPVQLLLPPPVLGLQCFQRAGHLTGGERFERLLPFMQVRFVDAQFPGDNPSGFATEQPVLHSRLLKGFVVASIFGLGFGAHVCCP